MTQAPTAQEERRLHDIKLILKDLLKVIKVVAMYPEGNPLPQSLKRSFSEKLVNIIEAHGTLKISITSDTLTYRDHEVYKDASKEESLAALFFTTGVTSITFREGLDVLEIYKFLDILKEYQNSASKNADLACMLWEANFDNFAFETIEDIKLAEYDGDFQIREINLERGAGGDGEGTVALSYDSIFVTEEGEDLISELAELGDIGDDRPDTEITPEMQKQFEQLASTAEGRALIRQRIKARKRAGMFHTNNVGLGAGETILDSEEGVDVAALKVSEAAQAMGLGDLKPKSRPLPDTTLILNDEFKLSEEEEQEIKVILEEDTHFDMYESTIELLKELLFQESELSAFFETVSICEKIVQDFVSIGRLNEAREVLQYLQHLQEELSEDKPLWAERLRDARITSGSRERLKFLVESLNGMPDISMTDLRDYLDLFGWESLGAITDLLGDLQHRAHREALCDYLSVRGRDNIAIVSKGMYDKRWYVVRNSVAILARLDDEKAMNYLQRAVTHEDRRVRLELMKALKESRSPLAVDILRKAAVDPDVEIRHEALASILARGGPQAFEAVAEILGNDKFTTFGQGEQQAILNAYSALGGAQALEYFDQLITRPNVFRDQLVTFYRQAAFKALIHNASAEAEQYLTKLASSWRPELRKQAKVALDLRRQFLQRQADQAAVKPSDGEEEGHGR